MDACSISGLDLTFIPIENMVMQLIRFTPIQFMPHVLVTKILVSDNRLNIISIYTRIDNKL